MESRRAGRREVQVSRWRRVDAMRKWPPIIVNQCKVLRMDFEFFFPKRSGTLQINLYKIITKRQNNLMKENSVNNLITKKIITVYG